MERRTEVEVGVLVVIAVAILVAGMVAFVVVVVGSEPLLCYSGERAALELVELVVVVDCKDFPLSEVVGMVVQYNEVGGSSGSRASSRRSSKSSASSRSDSV